eukprot:1699869-Alexandrium_andersonii.AAC.1
MLKRAREKRRWLCLCWKSLHHPENATNMSRKHWVTRFPEAPAYRSLFSAMCTMAPAPNHKAPLNGRCA